MKSKNTISSVLLICATVFKCYSQFTFGVSAGIAEQYDSKLNSIVLSPKLGYNVLNSFLLIGEAHYYKSYDWLNDNEQGKINNNISNAIYLGIGARYFLIQSKNCGILFIGSSLNLDPINRQWLWFITPGIYYDLEKFTIEVNFDIVPTPISRRLISVELGLNIKL